MEVPPQNYVHCKLDIHENELGRLTSIQNVVQMRVSYAYPSFQNIIDDTLVGLNGNASYWHCDHQLELATHVYGGWHCVGPV
jgi:hypothetical protein